MRWVGGGVPEGAAGGIGPAAPEEEEDEEEASPTKKPKKATARSETEKVRATIGAPFKQPARQSSSKDQPAKPAPKGKTSIAKCSGVKLATTP